MTKYKLIPLLFLAALLSLTKCNSLHNSKSDSPPDRTTEISIIDKYREKSALERASKDSVRFEALFQSDTLLALKQIKVNIQSAKRNYGWGHIARLFDVDLMTAESIGKTNGFEYPVHFFVYLKLDTFNSSSKTQLLKSIGSTLSQDEKQLIEKDTSNRSFVQKVDLVRRKNEGHKH